MNKIIKLSVLKVFCDFTFGMLTSDKCIYHPFHIKETFKLISTKTNTALHT